MPGVSGARLGNVPRSSDELRDDSHTVQLLPEQGWFRRFPRRSLRLIVLTIAMTALMASSAWAQVLTPTNGPNPNYGTLSLGEVEIQLAATGGAGPGTYTWSVVPGIGTGLPPGVSLRTDVAAWPGYRLNEHERGLAWRRDDPRDVHVQTQRHERWPVCQPGCNGHDHRSGDCRTLAGAQGICRRSVFAIS